MLLGPALGGWKPQSANCVNRRWKFTRAPRSTPISSDNDSLRWCVYHLRARARLVPKPHRVFAISQRRFRDRIVRCRGVHLATTLFVATYYDTYLISREPTRSRRVALPCGLRRYRIRPKDDGDLRHGGCEHHGRTNKNRLCNVARTLYFNHQQRPLRGEALCFCFGTRNGIICFSLACVLFRQGRWVAT